jgi:AraC-like DNA-binding protein
MPRILDYVRRHLYEPDLTAQQIAAAHHISLRYLYKLCERDHLSLESLVIAQRLAAAKAELVSRAGRRQTIAAVAHSCGFANPSFPRFQRTYGLSPREWRRLHAHS